MTFPHSPQPGPRPGPPPGGFRPGPPPGGFRPGPPPAYRPAPAPGAQQGTSPADHEPGAGGHGEAWNGEDTGHPAVDAVLRSLANAARLAPAEQIAEYEAAHQVLQETLASIDR
ncbi:hypothetical protein AB0M02_18660 [Actinoplanes sp. NPDC051861]|uniref:hypothetical protein n=1 Tax=Actinoplanes sp. NPDC051861 TaxID=3155170 RepID=UPI00343B0171